MKYLLLIFLLGGCNASQKLRRAEKLIAQAEAMGAKVRVDTIYINKVVQVKGADGEIKFIKGRDTVIFVNKIKVITKFKHDTVLQTINCPDSTIYFKNPVAIKKTIACPPSKNNFWKGFAFGVLALILGYVAVTKLLTDN